MLLAPLTLLLAAAPLSVRVLEATRPTTVTVTGPGASCDGAPLSTPVSLRAGGRDVLAGERACGAVRVTGPTTVTVVEPSPGAPLSRTYPGALTVTVEGTVLELVNEVDLEAYLPGVVEAEAGGQPPSGLEAQAVVSRTFALASRHRHGAAYDLCDLAHCQAYHGTGSAAAAGAVEKTRGQVLLLGGIGLKPTYFHAACGGHTSSAADVFGDGAIAGGGVPDLEGGKPRCEAAEAFTWSHVIERQALARAVGLRDRGEPVEALRRDHGGRILEARLFGQRVTGNELVARLNRALGFGSIKSADFSTQEVEGVIRFDGAGRGHGVGLCQAGAAKMAAGGATSAQILRHYFPLSRLAPVPEPLR